MTAARKGSTLTGSSRDNEKRTPRVLFDWLNHRCRFDYDAFAAHENALCDHYSTVDGTYRLFDRNAHPDNDLADGERRPHRVHSDDGLTYSWADRRVFCNPPYGRGIFMQCIEKMIAERNSAAIIVALIKCDTSTEAWRRIAAVSGVTYLPRVRYEGESAAATFASAIVVLRADVP